MWYSSWLGILSFGFPVPGPERYFPCAFQQPKSSSLFISLSEKCLKDILFEQNISIYYQKIMLIFLFYKIDKINKSFPGFSAHGKI